MNFFLPIVLAFVFSGCAVMTTPPTTSAGPAPLKTEEHAFASKETIRKLMLGISREEAVALIGRTVTTGYEMKAFGGGYKPVTTANPYRSQKITKASDVFEVDYYLTEVHKADSIVTDDELTPLVFQADKLIGKGWEFFNTKIKK